MDREIKKHRINQIKNRFLDAEAPARKLMEFKEHAKKDRYLSDVYMAIQKHFQAILAGRSDTFTEVTHNEVMNKLTNCLNKLE